MTTRIFIGAILIISISAGAQDSLFISEVTDPSDDYSGRFIELFNAGSDNVDFTAFTFYLSRQSNGGTSWGDVQLTGSVAAGETYVVGGSAFEALYGFAPDIETGILIGNGDDAYSIFRDGDHATGVLHDIFGVIDMDGTGELWEYEDSRAVRVATVLVPNSSWTPGEWVISGAVVADCDPGTHHGSAGTDSIPVPGNYSVFVLNDTVEIGQPVYVPVFVGPLTAEDNIISYQFDLDFESSVLEYSGYTLEETLGEGGTVAVNPGVSGKVSVSYMNSTAITGEGEILVLQFNSLALDSAGLVLSNVYLNNTPVQNVMNGTVIITETAPPWAIITYNHTVSRFADTLIITATFSEPMDAANPVKLSFSGAVTLAGADMTRLSDTVYNFLYPIPKAVGEVTVRLSNGTDLWGNEVLPVPTGGDIFSIIQFNLGDVNDDGMIQAFDAALTLQHSVGLDPLPGIDPLPWERWRDSTANVDGTGGITAYDAGIILQYSAGIISTFLPPAKKSAPVAGVTFGITANHIMLYSHGALVGLNLSTTNENGILGCPEILTENLASLGPSGFISAVNTGGSVFNIGLCTASPPKEGEAVIKIPFYKDGAVTFDMIVNKDVKRVTVDLVTGVDELLKEQVVLFPNPATDKLNISGLTGEAVYRICNSHGTVLKSARTGALKGEIDLSDLPPGLYILMLETNMETTVKRFLVK